MTKKQKRSISIKKRLVDYKNLKFRIRKVMRYEDVGDYFGTTIFAYDMKDDVVNNAIFLHEFIEYTLIKSAGINPAMIDRFDNDPYHWQKFPKEYKLYQKYHRLANKIERQFIENLGYNWEHHEKNIDTVPVRVAIERFTNQLHRAGKAKASRKRLQRAKKVIKETFKK